MENTSEHWSSAPPQDQCPSDDGAVDPRQPRSQRADSFAHPAQLRTVTSLMKVGVALRSLRRLHGTVASSGTFRRAVETCSDLQRSVETVFFAPTAVLRNETAIP